MNGKDWVQMVNGVFEEPFDKLRVTVMCNAEPVEA